MWWALASEGVKRRFEPVGFWVDKGWKDIRQDLEKRLDYCKPEVLFSDEGPGIEENLLSEEMRPQRCIWHGRRDFRFTRMERRKKSYSNVKLFSRAHGIQRRRRLFDELSIICS